MGGFINLEDSPMFRKQIISLEQEADEMKERCQKLYKGCKKFMVSLGEAYDGDLAFADALEAFGAGQDDPISVSIGGPVMSKFTTAFRELGTYKELLRSQMEHMLADRLLQFMSTDLQNVKDSRRRFDKASLAYDQACEKFISLKKGTRQDIVSELEEDLHNSKSAFERCRFNLVNSISNIESRKKYEFLESMSAVMDAHMRYFKQGYELLSQMEPFVNEVLTYAQQSKEKASAEHDKLAQRIQEFRTQVALANLSPARKMEASNHGDGIHVIGINSYKSIEELMHSSAKGGVKTLKQGYLFKQSSNLRGDWKRRFFVLDSHGTLYYYRNKLKQGSQSQKFSGGLEHGSSVFGRFRFSHQRIPSHGDEVLGCRTVDLRTSTIKIDAEQSDLRFCFRLISPMKTYTLQAENGLERMDWIDKITGVIASLLNSSYLEQFSPCTEKDNGGSSDMIDFSTPLGSSKTMYMTKSKGLMDVKQQENVTRVLQSIPGNGVCAECSVSGPEWASVNIGILICIECSGVHRNLGVHISKVRSLTLDVKVWEPTLLDLLSSLGNVYCNSVWEELLLLQDVRQNESDGSSISFQKPHPNDAISKKEKYIHSKYVEKLLIVKEDPQKNMPLHVRIWNAVKNNDLKAAYRNFVTLDASPNTRYDEVDDRQICHLVDIPSSYSSHIDHKQFDPALCQKIIDCGEPDSCLQGSALIHMACHVGDPVMLELLLQFGADINLQDYHGRTPLHHCVFKRNDALAKYLIKRGANTSIKDGGGLSPLERAMELGAITDEELFILLAGNF